jgi:hypothetical protein
VVTALVLLAGVVAPSGSARAGLADRVGATFALMLDDFVQTARPLEGLVVAVEDGRLYLDVGADAGAQVGQELVVFRRGEPYRHPYTGKVLGHHELVLGWAQILRVEPRLAEAAFHPAPHAPPPRPEDGVRIGRARVRVAVTPVLDLTGRRGDLRRVPFLMASVLEGSRRFLVVDPLQVADMFAGGALRVEEVLARPERAARIARNLEVTGWFVPVLLERRGTLYLDVTWISSITGAALRSRRLPLVPPGAVEEQRFPWEPRAED